MIAPHGAIVRTVNRALEQAVRTFRPNRPIDCAAARLQHRAYVSTLVGLGLDVTTLDAIAGAPDATFVEDTAVVLDEVALLTPPSRPGGRLEIAAVARALAPHRAVQQAPEGVRLEGGDVLRLDRTLYVGRSQRTNGAGIAWVRATAEPLGYRVVPVPVSGCLHLKTGCTRLPDGAVLIQPTWIDRRPFRATECVAVPPGEPRAANVLAVGGSVVTAAEFPHTGALLRQRGMEVHPVPLSEFLAAEAGVTCLSLLV